MCDTIFALQDHHYEQCTHYGSLRTRVNDQEQLPVGPGSFQKELSVRIGITHAEIHLIHTVEKHGVLI